MTKYAADTSVSSDRSRAEIERTLQRWGATQFMYGYDESKAIVAFTIKDRQVRFVLPMPDPNAHEFTHTPGRNMKRSPAQAREAWEQATRQRWRAMALVIKAKLEAVESGIVTFDAEFLAHIVLPNGRTVGDEVVPSVAGAYQTHVMPVLLPAIGAAE